MEEIGIFDAKTRFSELVERVNQRGKPLRLPTMGSLSQRSHLLGKPTPAE